MSSLLHRSRLAIACLAILTPLATASAARADRGGLAHNGNGGAPMLMQTAYVAHTPCNEIVIENPFTAWNDTAEYFLIKGGDLSNDAVDYGWDLGGGELVAQNNPYDAYPSEVSSLSLTEGDSATSTVVCVNPDLPTMRFFARNLGAETGTLSVDAIYYDQNLEEHTFHLGTLTSADASDAWTPSPILELAAPLVGVLDDGSAPVKFKFTVEGEGSSWLVDDVYVDPYGKG
jgi:hypothetical protein